MGGALAVQNLSTGGTVVRLEVPLSDVSGNDVPVNPQEKNAG